MGQGWLEIKELNMPRFRKCKDDGRGGVIHESNGGSVQLMLNGYYRAVSPRGRVGRFRNRRKALAFAKGGST